MLRGGFWSWRRVWDWIEGGCCVRVENVMTGSKTSACCLGLAILFLIMFSFIFDEVGPFHV